RGSLLRLRHRRSAHRTLATCGRQAVVRSSSRWGRSGAAMIPRYTPPDLAALWSPERRYAVWLEVELAACGAMEVAGVVPKGTAERIRAKNLVLDAARIDEIERTTKHDVIAFLTHVEELAGDDARWLHRGMTSNDVSS